MREHDLQQLLAKGRLDLDRDAVTPLVAKLAREVSARDAARRRKGLMLGAASMVVVVMTIAVAARSRACLHTRQRCEPRSKTDHKC